MPITKVKIFPSIGIARLGNSPTDFFIGPEIPGDRPPPAGGYKDARCRIKRQAARFRLFAYDENDNLMQEITAADGTINWTVHLANKKASFRSFVGLPANGAPRNSSVADRGSLEIDPGPRTLTGPNQAAGFNTGKFLGKIVPLGEMRTDAQNRLLVLGGFGNSESVPPGVDIVHYANNDSWHDDVSDGPVTASVTLNGTNFTASPAWVICPPPDFAPPIDSLTTLYDTLFQVAVDKTWLSIPAKPSFTNDIWPILQRVFNLQRTSALASSGHFDFDGSAAAAMNDARRLDVFNHLRDPNNPGAGGIATMPKLFDDSNGSKQTITKTQYAILNKWKGVAGVDWTNDWPGNPPPPPANITPDGLTKAALEACVGGAFYPGIEASWLLRDITKPAAFDYTEPFRLDHTDHTGNVPQPHLAGDITRQMAVPWQADFWKCQAGGGSLAWWPAQRPDKVFPETGGGPVPWTRELVSSHKDMVDQWQKLGFIVKKAGNLVETERRKVCTNIFLITDRGSFSDDEVNAALGVGSPARFDDSLYVVAEGFKPADLGLTPGTLTATYTPAALLAFAPGIALKNSTNNDAAGMNARPQKVLAEIDPPPADQLQRFTFVYDVEFTNNAAFLTDLEKIALTASKTASGSTYTSTGELKLFKKANPYMLDGATSWLSTDVRVFKVVEGEPLFGLPAIGNDGAAALSFIDSVVNNFRTASAVGHPFDSISINQQVSELVLAQQVKVGNAQKNVFNFAVARVRYRGNSGAPGVRVFFRLFTVAATGTDYDDNSTYRRTPGVTPISLLGLQAGKVVSIPCYGRVRKDTSVDLLTTQTDDLNVDNLQASGGTSEFQSYFGCWLDFNQPDKRFPVDVAGKDDGPWNLSELVSIQELIRGMHQCLVAEVYFKDDLINNGENPATSDNLAQRNLAIVESANPGVSATRTVQHTFELKATNPAPQIVFAGDGIDQERSVRGVPAGPDELMIRWGNLPRATNFTLYMPDVDVDEILGYAGQNYEAQRLERVDAHTIRCLPGDITYLPMPRDRKRNIAVLATLELPEGVKREQRFDLFFHQLSGRPRAVLGTFQMSVPVSTKAQLLEPETRKLSVLRHIALAIPHDDQWHPVFERYLSQIEDRVRGFGGDPDRVAPSLAGFGGDEQALRCGRLGWLFSLLLALTVFVAGLNPGSNYLAPIVAVALVIVAAVVWIKSCSPSRCRILGAVFLGLILGAAILAVLLLAGLAGYSGMFVLTLVALLLGILALLAMLLRCLRFAG